MPKPFDALVRDATEALARWRGSGQTADLVRVAETVFELRAASRLGDGRIDWSGRSLEYRNAMAAVYESAGVHPQERDTIQGAIRYHLGTILRERVPAEDIRQAGLASASPKQRLRATREALYAMQDDNTTQEALPKLVAYAQALLDFANADVIPAMDDDHLEAAEIGLRATQERAEALLGEVVAAKERRAAGPRDGGGTDRTHLQGV